MHGRRAGTGIGPFLDQLAGLTEDDRDVRPADVEFGEPVDDRGGPGVICSPVMNPSRSQGCTAAVDTPSSLPAFAIVTISPSWSVGRTGAAGLVVGTTARRRGGRRMGWRHRAAVLGGRGSRRSARRGIARREPLPGRVTSGRPSSLVAAPLAAHLRDGGARAAECGVREQVGRKVCLPAALLSREKPRLPLPPARCDASPCAAVAGLRGRTSASPRLLCGR